MSDLVHIKLHGLLGAQIGQSEWKLAAKSVGDAIRGVQCNSKKLYSQLIQNDKKNIKYRVLINEKDFEIDEGKDPNKLEDLATSELAIRKDGIKTIDIVPVIEGSDDLLSIITIVVGVALIGMGMGWISTPLLMGSGAGMQAALVLGGIGLVAAGVSNLLTEMPKFGDFREIEQGGPQAYIFNGPQNTIREGGPVFVGYGRLMIGSHVVQSAVDTLDSAADVTPKDTWGQTKYGLLYNIPNAGGLLANRASSWGKNPNK